MSKGRTERLTLRIKPAIKAQVESEAEARGQPLSIWFERLLETALSREEKQVQDAST